MLWSLTKVVAFLAIIAGLAVLAGQLSENGGTVRIWAFDHEFTLAPLAALIALILLVVAVWLGIKLLGLLGASLRFLNGDETALSRYFDRNRERRGYAALSEGMVALASGEFTTALARARTAERLLKKPELTLLLKAQAAEAAGDTGIATEAWKALLADENTRFVAVRGLLRQKLAAGDTETALKLAERAFALKPRHAETQDILLKLQADGGDWHGARGTLSQKHRSGSLPRSVYRRRDALLALQEAKVVLDEGSSIEAREAAIEANKLSPDLIPAAVIAAHALVEKGDRRGASRVLKKAWGAQPHPDLAQAFADIEPDETPEERLKRFKLLFKQAPDAEETHLTEAELLLAAEDFKAAKLALGQIPVAHPTQRALAMLAAAERGLGADDAVVRDILVRALKAPRGPEWCCDSCGAVRPQWGPICSSCGGFDTLSWRDPAPAHAQAAARGADLTQMILGPERPDEPDMIELSEALPPPEPAPAEPVAEAEVIEETPPVMKEVKPEPEEPRLSPDEILRRSN